MQTDNIVLDSLKALHEENPQFKIMFISAIKDALLAKYQNYIDDNSLEFTEKSVETYFLNLKNMCQALQASIPNVGLYIFDYRIEGLPYASTHTILAEPIAYELKVEGKKVLDWMHDATNNKVRKLGLDLLK